MPLDVSNLAEDRVPTGPGSTRKGSIRGMSELILERKHDLQKYFTVVSHFTDAPKPYQVTYNWPQEDATTGDVAVDDIVFTTTEKCRLVAISYTVAVVGSDGSAVTAQLKHGIGTDNFTAGNVLHTGTMNLKTTAHTVVNMTISTTLADLLFEAGERVTIDVTGTTAAARGNVTLTFVPWPPFPGFEVVGTNADAAGIEQLAIDGFRVETAGSSGDQQILQGVAWPESAFGGGIWSSARGLVFYCNVMAGPDAADVQNSILWAGLKLTNTSVIATDADQAFFRIANGTTASTWKCVTSVGGVDETFDTGITIVAATAYELCVAIDFDTREPNYYINGRHVHTGDPLTSLATLLWVIGVQTSASAAKELDIRNLLISQRYSADP